MTLLRNYLDVSSEILGLSGDVRFVAWLSPSSPFVSMKSGRITYAEWVSNKESVVHGRKGLYIWVMPRKGGFRFLHVGISVKGLSSLPKRTMAHCRNQFRIDPLHAYDEMCEFGRLRKGGSVGAASDVSDFLKKIRVLYLIPDVDVSGDVIRSMEGLIAYAAAGSLGLDQITNTLSKVRPPSLDRLPVVRDEINKIMPVFPSAILNLF